MAIERVHCRGDCTCASRQARPWRSSLSADTGRSLQYIAARVLPHPFRERRKKTHVLSHRTSELLNTTRLPEPIELAMVSQRTQLSRIRFCPRRTPSHCRLRKAAPAAHADRRKQVHVLALATIARQG